MVHSRAWAMARGGSSKVFAMLLCALLHDALATKFEYAAIFPARQGGTGHVYQLIISNAHAHAKVRSCAANERAVLPMRVLCELRCVSHHQLQRCSLEGGPSTGGVCEYVRCSGGLRQHMRACDRCMTIERGTRGLAAQMIARSHQAAFLPAADTAAATLRALEDEAGHALEEERCSYKHHILP